MDIIKLRNDYLKKINKSASELNRRLVFLNEINNKISHNNMVGGSDKRTDVDEIMKRNNVTTEQIINLIKSMKATHSETSKEVIKLRESINISKEAMDLLETENGDYIRNINQLSGLITNIDTELKNKS